MEKGIAHTPFLLIIILAMLAVMIPAAPVSAESGKVDLVLVSTSHNIIAGSTFTVTVEAQCGSQTVHGIDLFLDYDPSFLSIQSVTAGATLSTVLAAPVYDNVAGTFNFSAGKLVALFPSDTFNLVSLTFQAKSIPTTSTAISFHTSGSRKTSVVWGENDVTGALTQAEYSILAIPSVISVVPAGGTADVALDSSVVLTFSKSMDHSATQSAFSLTPSVPGGAFSWNTDSTVMTFTHTTNFDSNTLYTVLLDTTSLDTEGVHPISTFSSTFTTVKALVSIAVSPGSVSVAKGRTQQFTAEATYSDGSHSPVPIFSWSSSNTAKVTIDGNGLATAQAVAASVTITAASGSIQGTAAMTVTAAELTLIDVLPSSVTLAKGQTQQFSVFSTYTDGAHNPVPTVNWSSSDEGKVVINSSGLATAQAVTTSDVTITAISGAVQDTAKVNVTAAVLSALEVTPTNITLAKGQTRQYSVIPTYSDGTHTPAPPVTWSSSDSGKVSIDSSGLATAIEITSNAVSITALSGTITGSTGITVTPGILESILIQPDGASLAKGLTKQFSVYPSYSDGSNSPIPIVTWSSSDTGKVGINSSTGLAAALDITVTAVTITATTDSIQDTASITVTPAQLTAIAIGPSVTSLPRGRTQQYTITPTYTDGSHVPVPVITWTSDNAGKVSIDDTGLAKAEDITESPVKITASFGDISDSIMVSVTEAVLDSITITPSGVTIAKGVTLQYSAEATYSDGPHTPSPVFTWTCSDPDKVIITSNGLATALAVTYIPVSIKASIGTVEGTVTLTVTLAELTAIDIGPSVTSLFRGRTQQYNVTPAYTDGSNSPVPVITWTSTDSEKVSIDDAGLAKAENITQSPVKITASSGSISDSIMVSVTDAVLDSISVTPSGVSIAKGITLQYSAEATYSDGPHNPSPVFTWTCSDYNKVSISDTGLATALNVTDTPVSIKATIGTVEGTATLAVTLAELTAIDIGPSVTSLPRGRTQQYTITPTYTDGSHVPVPVITWTSDNAGKVSIDDAGLAKAEDITESPVKITASFGDISDSIMVSVTEAVLENIALAPSGKSIAKGLTLQYSAEATYSDGPHTPSPVFTWTSSDPDKVSITSNGLATALAVTDIPVSIKATIGTVEGTATLAVTAAELIAIELNPSEVTLTLGLSQQFTFIPTYTDGSHEPVPVVDWSSSDPAKVIISGTGMATAVGVTEIPVTITATHGALHGNAIFSVIPVVLESLTLSPSEVSVVKGGTQQFTAKPLYSNGSTSPLPVLTWTSSDEEKVTIDGSGLAAATNVTPAFVTITAISGSVSATAKMLVTSAVLESISVDPPALTLVKGTTRQFSVIPTYSDQTHSPVPFVSWSSSDDDKVSIDHMGLATAKSVTETPVTITAASGTFLATAAVTVLSTVDMFISPSAQTIISDETLTLDIIAQCGTQATDEIGIYLDFDPAYLEVKSAQAGNSLSTVKNGSTWNNTAGTFEFSAAQLEPPYPGGTFTVVSLTLGVKSIPASATVISFHTSEPRKTMVLWQETDITGSLTPGAYSILARPEVLSVTPAGGAKSVAVNSSVVLTFNKAMDQAATQSAFSLSPAVNGSFSWNQDGNTMTFKPGTSLSKSKTYTLDLSTAAVDLQSIPLAGAFSSTFTTVKSGNGGGGGGGGGGSSTLISLNLTGFTDNSALSLDSSGVIQAAAKLKSADGRLIIEISQGSRLLTSTGSILTGISISPLMTLPQTPDDYAIVLAYAFSPDGATFDPALKIILSYDPGKLPSGLVEKDLYIAFYDGTKWQKVETQVNTSAKTAAAHISHFSSYALMGNVIHTTPTATAVLSQTPVPSTLPPQTSTPALTQKPTPSTSIPSKTTTIPATTTPAASPASPVTSAPVTPRETAAANKPISISRGLAAGFSIAMIAVFIIAIFLILRRKQKKNQRQKLDQHPNINDDQKPDKGPKVENSQKPDDKPDNDRTNDADNGLKIDDDE